MPREPDRIVIEQLAREAAERLLTPTERAEVNRPEKTRETAPERPLEERLADIDRRAQQWAVEERRGILEVLLVEAKKRFEVAISKTPDHELRSLHERVRLLERMNETA